MPTSLEAFLTIGSGEEVEVEDPTTDLDTRIRHSGKRKAPFSPDQPAPKAPKIPRVVKYIDSSSGGKDANVRVTDTETRVHASPKIQTESFTGDLAGSSPRVDPTTNLNVVDPPSMPSADASGSSPSGQFREEPTLQAMLRAMSLGHAYFGDYHWSCFMTGALSDRLQNFFNVVAYVSCFPSFPLLL